VAVLVIGGTTAVVLTRGTGQTGGGSSTSAAADPTGSVPSEVRGLPKSALPLPNSELAFASRQNDNMDVWTMQGSDGSGKKRLVNVPGVDDYLPAISPDRKSVAYIRIRGLQSELHVVAADGTGDIALTTDLAPDARPSWSPDGTTLVFASAIDGQTDLYTASFEFSDKPPRLGPPTRLTNSPATEADPAWSPDGKRIVYWSNASGVQNLYWVAPDGGPETRLTDGPDTDADPTWAPDGQHLAFTRTAQSAPSDIYVLALDSAGRATGAPVNLTADLTGPDEDSSWSADGGSIAFVHKADTGSDIWVMDTAGGGKKQITDNKDWDGHPAWGPFAAG
jgi:TolB protein